MSKVAIVGCGAMGSVYAALMVSAGHEVHGVTKWLHHAEAMAAKGLRVEGASGDRTVQLASAGTTTNEIAFATSSSLPRRHLMSRRRPAPMCH